MCGPATIPITRASTLKCPSASISCAATFSWPAVSGRAASSVERVSLAASGQLPDEVGRVGDLAAVAALRRELLGLDGLGRPARDARARPRPGPRRGRSSSGTCSGSGSRLGSVPAPGGALRRRDPGSARRPTRSSRRPWRASSWPPAWAWASRTRASRRTPRAARPARAWSARASPGRRPRAGAACGTAPRSSRVVEETESDVALITPATDAPVSSSTPAMNRKIARMCAPTVPASVVTTQSKRLPHHAAAGLDPRRVPPVGRVAARADRVPPRGRAWRRRRRRSRRSGTAAPPAGPGAASGSRPPRPARPAPGSARRRAASAGPRPPASRRARRPSRSRRERRRTGRAPTRPSPIRSSWRCSSVGRWRLGRGAARCGARPACGQRLLLGGHLARPPSTRRPQALLAGGN